MGRHKVTDPNEKAVTLKISEQRYQLYKTHSQQNYRSLLDTLRLVLDKGTEQLIKEGVFSEPPDA